MRCPVCATEFNLEVTGVYSDKHNYLSPSLEVQPSLENLLRETLLRYWRWVTEGKKEYKKEQLYYDKYHRSMNYIPEEDIYEFNIQVYDSPQGDQWVKGKFKLSGAEIIILEKETVRI